MKIKWLFSLLGLVVIVSLVLVGCAPKPVAPPTAPPAPEVIKWRMGSTWTPAINLIESDRYFVKKINEMSGGRLVITHYPAGEIVPAFELFDAVSKGTLEAGCDWPSYWAGKNSAFDLLGSFGFGFTPGDYFIWVYQGGGLELMRELFARYNIHYVPISMTPTESGFRTNKPIRTLDDFKGLTLRAPLTQTMWVLEQLGAKPVKISGGEIYMALKLGTVDGAEFCSPGVDWGMKFQEVTKYWCLPGWHQPSSLLGCMINMDAWKKLPPDLQAIIEEAGKASVLWSYAFYEWDSIAAVKNFEDVGTIVTYLDEPAIRKIEELSMKFAEIEAAKNPDYAKVLNSMMSYLKSFEKVRKVEGIFGFGRNPTKYPEVK